MKTKSNTEKTCPSCGLHTHSRSSSNLCPKKKQKEPSHNPDEKKETFAIKSSLKNICTDTRVYEKIASVVAYTTKAIHVGSLFMNYIFLKLLNKGEQVPIIDHTLVYSIFTVVTGNGKKVPKYCQDYFVEFCNECQVNETILQSLKSIGYSSVLSIMCKQYDVLIRNHVCENHERRTTRFFLEAFSDMSSPFYCKGLSVAQRKALSHYVYTLKQKQQSIWPSSLERNQCLEETIEKMNALWSRYQTMNCDAEDLYSKPHEFFKWFFYLQQKINEKVYIMEEKPATFASKSYIYRKLKELTFTSILNRRSFKSLQEQVLQSINSKIPLVLGKKLEKLEPHLPALLKFITSIQSRIEDGTFTPAKYTDRRGYRFFSILPVYSFAMKSIQIDAQAFWRLLQQSGIENIPKGVKDKSALSDFYYRLFNFSKMGFRTRKSLSEGKKQFQ